MASKAIVPEKLPHQKVFESIGKTYKTFFNNENDPKNNERKNFGRIESRYEAALEMPDETEEEIAKKDKEIAAAIASSEKFGGLALELIEKQNNAALLATQATENYTRLMNEGIALASAGKLTESLVPFGEALALNVDNAAAQTEIDKVNAALLLAQQEADLADKQVKYTNLLESAAGRIAEKDYEQALVLYNNALELGINNDEVQVKIAEVAELQQGELITKNVARSREILTDVNAILTEKGTITHIQLTDAGVGEYPADAKTWKLGGDSIGMEINLEKVEEGVYKLHKASAAAAPSGKNQAATIVKWVVGIAAGSAALYFVWKKFIQPKYFPKK